MASYSPNGLSFRALTILIDHIENGGIYPIIHYQPVNYADGNRSASTTRLVERGYLRVKNSKYTTITAHGHKKFCEAAAAWADFLTRLNLANEAGEAYTLRQFNAEKNKKEGRPRDIPAPVASGCRNPLADRQGEAVPTECAGAL